MADWLDDIPGVKDVIDGTGETDVPLPRRAKLRLTSSGRVADDPVNGWTNVPVGPWLMPTAVKTSDYLARAGDLVLVDLSDGNVVVGMSSLPAGSCIGVKIVGGGAGSNVCNVVAQDDDLVGDQDEDPFSMTNVNEAAVFVRGEAGWYCMSVVPGHSGA